jgi:hypothetical protein
MPLTSFLLLGSNLTLKDTWQTEDTAVELIENYEARSSRVYKSEIESSSRAVGPSYPGRAW